MKNKVWYWVVGALVVIVIIVLILFAARSDRAGTPPAGSGTDHAGMDHGSLDMGSPSGTASDVSDLESYLLEQDDIMARMMEEMEAIAHTGSADVDFLAGMLPHHRSAVEMAQSYLRYAGRNAAFSRLAQEIIDAQNREIEQMGSMIETLNMEGNKDEEREAAYLEAYGRLFSGHQMLHSTAADLDTAFAEGMTMHHQMAVDMAKAILEHSDEPAVIDLARSIVATQEREIAEMRQYLGEPGSSL